jgi:hypothetical protein
VEWLQIEKLLTSTMFNNCETIYTVFVLFSFILQDGHRSDILSYPQSMLPNAKLITFLNQFPILPSLSCLRISPRQSRHFRHLRITTRYSLPLAKYTTQRGLTTTRLRCATSTSGITTHRSYICPCFPSRLGVTTCVVYLPAHFIDVLPYPVFCFFIPFTLELFFTYRTGLVCERASRGGDNCVGLGR